MKNICTLSRSFSISKNFSNKTRSSPPYRRRAFWYEVPNSLSVHTLKINRAKCIGKGLVGFEIVGLRRERSQFSIPSLSISGNIHIGCQHVLSRTVSSSSCLNAKIAGMIKHMADRAPWAPILLFVLVKHRRTSPKVRLGLSVGNRLYHPTRRAQSLRNGRSKILAASAFGFIDGFFDNMCRHLGFFRLVRSALLMLKF